MIFLMQPSIIVKCKGELSEMVALFFTLEEKRKEN